MAEEFKNVSLTFGYEGTKPNFRRDQYTTLADMKAVVDTIDEGHISFCLEDKKTYQFLSSNTVDERTGKWRVFISPSEVEALKAKVESLQSNTSSGNQITFLDTYEDYKALPEEQKNKRDHLFVIGRKDR